MNQPTEPSDNLPQLNRGSILLFGGTIIMLFIAVGFAAKMLLENIGTTAMQLASEGQLTAAQIDKVEFLQRKPRDPWPFSQSDYDKLPSTQLPVDEYPELVRLLAMAEMKRIHGNHPSTPAEGIVRIQLKDGRQFILFFDVRHQADKPYYVEFDALLENKTDPNLSRRYSFPEETPEMVDFLRKHNAWVDQTLTQFEDSQAK